MSSSYKWDGARLSIRRFVRDETGATAIEYGLIAGLIAAVIVVAVTAVGNKLVVVFNNIAAAL
ncbi:MAG: Flp family type IVb pilin [Janthinobacterium lividum]